MGRSPQTVELRHSQLRFVAREIGAHSNAVTEDDLTTFFACYGEERGPETRKSYRAAVRAFFD
ncbi:hypothetical protein [Mycolicibacterium sphagni]|uniref:Integrase n=1 Tax=Mycolicibacterium sphagni TaxID=1786 RepID=A0A255DTP0_9MYCO|nr:hypothetical protein [Mycolicibacterium sphagni]OYN82758.1 hypothetical protein CG716_00650 [Mycolicibacterium sphagni]